MWEVPVIAVTIAALLAFFGKDKPSETKEEKLERLKRLSELEGKRDKLYQRLLEYAEKIPTIEADLQEKFKSLCDSTAMLCKSYKMRMELESKSLLTLYEYVMDNKDRLKTSEYRAVEVTLEGLYRKTKLLNNLLIALEEDIERYSNQKN